jgi:hypothetical protein
MTETGPARPPWSGPPAVRSPGQAGSRIDDEVLARISPAHSENINFFGAIEVRRRPAASRSSTFRRDSGGYCLGMGSGPRYLGSVII